MNKVSIRKHRRTLSFLKKLIKKLAHTGLLKRLNCSGLVIDVRGKIGVTGSKKKRHITIVAGQYSSTNKTLR